MRQFQSTIVAWLGLFSLAAVGCKSGWMNETDDQSYDGLRRGGLLSMNASVEPQSSGDLSRARDMERSGQTKEALQLYAQIAETNPRSPVVWHRMAVAYDKIGLRLNADECFGRALALDPMNADLWTDFGYGQFLRGDFASAEQSFRRALLIQPTHDRAHNNLGLALAKAGNPAAAIEQFRLAGCDENQARRNLELANATPLMPGDDRTALVAAPPSSPPQATPTGLSVGQAPLPMPTSQPRPAQIPSPELLPVQVSALPSNSASGPSSIKSEVAVDPTMATLAGLDRAPWQGTASQVAELPGPVIEPSPLAKTDSTSNELNVPANLVSRTASKSIEQCATGLLPMAETKTTDGIHRLMSDESVEGANHAATDSQLGVTRRIGDEE